MAGLSDIMRSRKKSRSRRGAKRPAGGRVKRISARSRRSSLLQERLQLFEEHLSLAVAAAGLGTWRYDVATGQLSWSERCRKLFGVAPNVPLTYEFFLQLVHPEDRSRVDKRVGDALATRKDYQEDFRIQRRDGTVRWITAHGRSHYDRRGKAVRMEGVVLDVTERSLAVEKIQGHLDRIKALREIETAITSTLDLDRMLHLLLDRIDDVTRYAAATVRLVNRETGRLEPVAAKNIDVEKWKQGFSKIPGGLSQVVLESTVPVVIPDVQDDPRTRHQHFMREEGLVSFVGLPLAAKNEVLGVLAVFTRERRVFDDEDVEFLTTVAGQAAIAIHNAQLYENMVKANNVKQQFLSVMSHELRTPLSVVMGYSGMLMERMFGDINPQQEEALHKILTRAAEQLHLINAIIQTTQLESHALRVDRNPVPLAQIVEHVRDEMEAICDEKAVALEWEYPNEPIRIVTDTAKVVQILRNLIANAVKFTRSGSVTVATRLKDAEKPSGDGRKQTAAAERVLELRITDTGVGIPRDQWDRIFDKFYQVDSSETRLYGGLGLGLYVVKKFVEMLGGTIRVDSEPGRGSTFWVTIPCESVIGSSPSDARPLL